MTNVYGHICFRRPISKFVISGTLNRKWSTIICKWINYEISTSTDIMCKVQKIVIAVKFLNLLNYPYLNIQIALRRKVNILFLVNAWNYYKSTTMVSLSSISVSRNILFSLRILTDNFPPFFSTNISKVWLKAFIHTHPPGLGRIFPGPASMTPARQSPPIVG